MQVEEKFVGGGGDREVPGRGFFVDGEELWCAPGLEQRGARADTVDTGCHSRGDLDGQLGIDGIVCQDAALEL